MLSFFKLLTLSLLTFCFRAEMKMMTPASTHGPSQGQLILYELISSEISYTLLKCLDIEYS